MSASSGHSLPQESQLSSPCHPVEISSKLPCPSPTFSASSSLLNPPPLPSPKSCRCSLLHSVKDSTCLPQYSHLHLGFQPLRRAEHLQADFLGAFARALPSIWNVSPALRSVEGCPPCRPMLAVPSHRKPSCSPLASLSLLGSAFPWGRAGSYFVSGPSTQSRCPGHTCSINWNAGHRVRSGLRIASHRLSRVGPGAKEHSREGCWGSKPPGYEGKIPVVRGALHPFGR